MVKNGGLKKASLYDHFWRFDNWLLFLAKQDPLGGGQIEKNAFLTLFWWENMISDMSQWFLNGQKWGLKKHLCMTILKVWQLTLYFGKSRPPGKRLYKKMLFKPSSDEKTWFLTCPVVFKWLKMGVKKSISVWPFWRFDNWLLFW